MSLIVGNDGLPARKISAHSLEKAHVVRRYADIVGTAMKSKWITRAWVELFAGPGRLKLDNSFHPGSPLDALGIRTPFTHYFFSDADQECIDALRQRLDLSGANGLAKVIVNCGDANGAGTFAAVSEVIPTTALVVFYLDPEGLELEFETVRRLAQQFPKADFLINLSMPGVDRVVNAGRQSAIAQVSRMLDCDDPVALLQRGRPAVIQHYVERLADLGFSPPPTHEVKNSKNSALYHLLLASRHEKGRQLFEQATAVELYGQRSLPF